MRSRFFPRHLVRYASLISIGMAASTGVLALADGMISGHYIDIPAAGILTIVACWEITLFIALFLFPFLVNDARSRPSAGTSTAAGRSSTGARRPRKRTSRRAPDVH